MTSNFDKKYLSIFVLAIGFFLTGFYCLAQTADVKFNRDSSHVISKADFDKLIDTCTLLLQTKQLKDISDAQHIKIMMTLNTIGLKNFEGGKYEHLEKVSREKNYMKDIIKVYPEWSPNRGMGYYFPKLKMELYGTPSPYAVYTVTK